jgi:oxygen-independent coproporphyrinogen-3 oxidase
MDTTLQARYDRAVPRYTSYPTAPNFHGGIGARDYARWLGVVPAGVAVSLYVHIPFCRSLCWFCGCHTRVVNREAPVLDYLDLLEREIGLVADRLREGHGVSHLHWGGGTPTILGPLGTARLAAALRRRFELRADAEFAVEVDPRTLTPATVDALAEAGVTRASLGVQDLAPAVQRAVNRVQPYAVTERAARRLREAGIRALNVDLMYGLPHQTESGLAETVDAVVALGPQRIALFGYAHVPWMKRHQKLIDEAVLPDGAMRLRQYAVVGERLRAAGYAPVGLDHFAAPDDALAVARRAGELRRNFQGYTQDGAEALIGLGCSAIGMLPDGYVQNAVSFRDYADAVEAGRLATVRGVAVSDDDRLRRRIIERLMCDLEVDVAAEAAAFGRTAEDFAEAFARLAPMAADGLVEIDGAHVRVTEGARVLVRVVAAAFDAYLHADGARHARAV